MTSTLERTIGSVIGCTHGWSPQQKCIQLAEWILAEKPQIVVELGVFGGRSLIPMALAMQENKSGVAWGIDPWTKEAAVEGDADKDGVAWWTSIDIETVYLSFILNVYRYQLSKWCQWIRAKAEVAVRMFEDESVGLVHLDSNHSEVVSCRQVVLWQPKMKPGSILVMDDVHWPSQRKALAMIHQFTDPIGKWEVDGQHYAAFRVREKKADNIQPKGKTNDGRRNSKSLPRSK